MQKYKCLILLIVGVGIGPPAWAQNIVCDPTCRDPTTTSANSQSAAKAKSSSLSNSRAQGAVNGSVSNAPITSNSRGGSARSTSTSSGGAGGSSNVVVVNRVSSGGGGGSGGWSRRGGSTASDPPATTASGDPAAQQVGSPGLPLTENLSTSGTTTIRDVPEIVAPNISGGNPCLVGVSGGGAGPGIGITLGFGYSDRGCERRNSAALLNNIGEKQAAVELMCDDEHVREALARAGKPCEADRARAAAAAPVAVAGPVDPAVIRRQQEVGNQVAVMAIQPQPIPVVAKPPARPDWCYTASAAELKAHPQCN